MKLICLVNAVIGSTQSSSKVISVIALSDAASVVTCMESCLQQSSWNCNGDSVATSSLINAYYGTHKSKLTYLLGHSRDIFKSVELTKLADIVLFVVHATEDGSTDIIDKVVKCFLFLCFSLIYAHFSWDLRLSLLSEPWAVPR